jgi:hypothetical protein
VSADQWHEGPELTLHAGPTDEDKATQREGRRRPMDPTVKFGDTKRTGSFYHDARLARGVRTPVMPSGRARGQCVGCPHGWKHHTKAGRCRPGCECGMGAKR